MVKRVEATVKGKPLTESEHRLMADLRNIRRGHPREAEIGRLIRDVFQRRISEEDARKYLESLKAEEKEARVEEEFKKAREEEEEKRVREEEFIHGEGGPGIGVSVSGKAGVARTIAVGIGIAAAGALIYIFFLM